MTFLSKTALPTSPIFSLLCTLAGIAKPNKKGRNNNIFTIKEKALITSS